MAAEKVTPMILKADLQCPCCYKKIKKTLCKFPQIRDQMYNEKANTVAITVVCCSPEKIRDKLCRRGGKAIKSIEIVEPQKKKDSEKPKDAAAGKPKEAAPKPAAAEKPKEAGAEKPKPAAAEKPKEAAAEKPKEAAAEKPKPKDAEKPKEKPKEAAAEKPKADGAEKPKDAPPEQAKPKPAPVNGVPSVFPYIMPAYDAYSAGPYYHGYGFPPPPPQPCYEGYAHGHGYGGYSHAHGHGYGYGEVAHVNKSDSYFSEENPQACTIM